MKQWAVILHEEASDLTEGDEDLVIDVSGGRTPQSEEAAGPRPQARRCAAYLRNSKKFALGHGEIRVMEKSQRGN